MLMRHDMVLSGWPMWPPAILPVLANRLLFFNQWQDLSLDGGTRPVPGVDIDLALEPLELLRDCFRTLIDVFDENPVRINLLGSEDLSKDLVLPFETVVLLLDVTDLLFLERTFLFEQDFYRINSLGRLLVTLFADGCPSDPSHGLLRLH